MDADDKIRRARFQLLNKSPFWGYLTLHLKLVRSESIETIGVDNVGHLIFNPNYLEDLTDSEMQGVLAHEVSHLMLEDFDRLGTKDMFIWNIATDIVNNMLLIKHGFTIPENALKPNLDGSIILGSEPIRDVDKKTAEEIYDELIRDLQQYLQSLNGKNPGFDQHNYDGNNQKTKINWRGVVAEAYNYSKIRGSEPGNEQRLVEGILYPTLNWKKILENNVENLIPQNMTYERPSKASIVSGCFGQEYYLPSIEDDLKLEVVVSIDTSGSIGKTELEEFIAEINKIQTQFSSIDLTTLVCDAEISQVIKGKINTKNLVLSGGGGTSHVPIFNWIKENKKHAKLLVAFTDGYTEFPESFPPKLKVIWVLTRDHNDISKFPPKQKVILLGQ